MAGYFRGVYISRNENFREVAVLGKWVWFSINFSKIIIPQIAAISKFTKYTPLKK